MKNKPLFISIASLILAIFLSAAANTISNKTSVALPVSIESTHTLSQNGEEMRAVWVPFMSLDMKDTDYSETTFKARFDEIVSCAVAHKMNTLIVHVRPFSDALYPSKYFPASVSMIISSEVLPFFREK